MSGEELAWTTVRPVATHRAVWVDKDNARAVAEQFGGAVNEVPWMGRTITRIAIGRTSRPVGFWLSADGQILDDRDWEEVDEL